MRSSRRALAPVLLLAPCFSLWAQAKPAPAVAVAAAVSACPTEITQPIQPQPLGIAFFQRAKIAQAKTPGEAGKVIRDAMKSLFDDKNKSNALGRDFLLGQFYILAIESGDIQTRGDLGMPGDKAAKVDLVTGADSLFTIIEKAQPACASEVLQWREFKPFQNMSATAYKALAAGAVDSAERLARRAQILNKNGAQSYDILWRVAQKRGDEAGQVTNLQAAIDRLAGDTANANVRSNFMFNLGRIQRDFGDKKSDKAAKAAQYKSATSAYMTLLKEYPTSEEAPFAFQEISNITTITSDTTSALAAVAIIKASPEKFNDMALATAGVLATRSGKSADAVAMFDAAVKKNPYSRDYLYNLAAMLYEAKRSSEMSPFVRRLVEVDPSNSENVMLFAYSFKGLSDNEKDPKAKKALIDSVALYSKKADDLNMVHKVVYLEFDRAKEHTTLRGQVENHGKVAKSYTIDFEFVGKDGAVLGKQTASVANVKPNGAGDFTVELPLGGVYGVRYAALPLK